MDDDWDVEDTPVTSGSSNTPPTLAPPAAAVPPPSRAPQRKWDGEDEEDDDDDWDKSEDEKPKAKAAAVAPAKKKMTLKQKLAEKEKLAQEKALRGDDEDELIPTMTEQDRRRMAREREIEADLAVASDLLGASSLNESASTPGGSGAATPAGASSLYTAKPKTKDDFAALAKLVTSEITSRHASNPLYATFVEALAKELCEGLNAVQTRKVSSALSVLGNTKQAEERDKASGKKKTAAKPKLGGAKTITKVDTDAYDDVLEDDDFM